MKNETEQMRAVRLTINKLKKLNCNAWLDQENERSYYIWVTIKSIKRDFILRLSDHDLTDWNQLPAGVINESFYNNDYPIETKFLRWEIKDVINMNEEEYNTLWTNRDLEYDSIGMIRTIN